MVEKLNKIAKSDHTGLWPSLEPLLSVLLTFLITKIVEIRINKSFATYPSFKALSTVKWEKLSSLAYPPPILGAFYNNEKNILFVDIEQAISQ